MVRYSAELLRCAITDPSGFCLSQMVETACSVLNPSGDEANLSFGKYAGKEKVDPLLVSAHRCWQTVVAQEATQRADA